MSYTNSNIIDFFDIIKKFNITTKFVNHINDGILIEFETENGFFLLDYTVDDIAFLFRNNDNKRWVYDIEKTNFIKRITDILVEHNKQI